ncbi:MAG: hypothetical protein INR65_03665 [Gluconacetobacter diazotrophicus]|nr:hypothetical protein [Gluconacetobacter diazotrophicus]
MSTRPALFATAALLLAGCAAPPPAPSPDVAALMREIAGQPYRYGGALIGTVPGLAGPVDQPPVHLAIGLSAPEADGTLHGRAILFDAERRLVAEGPVTGRLDPGFSPVTRPCALHLSLPQGPVDLSGTCTATLLSGEVVSQPGPPDLVTRIAFWWGDRATTGRYWLDRDSFDPPA